MDELIKAAYSEGVTAYANGLRAEDNPYHWLALEQAWMDCWSEAWELAQEIADAYGY